MKEERERLCSYPQLYPICYSAPTPLPFSPSTSVSDSEGSDVESQGSAAEGKEEEMIGRIETRSGGRAEK